MKKKFLQILALAALVAVPASALYSQSAPSDPAAEKATKSKKSKKSRWPVISFSFEKPVRDEWHVNYPDKLVPADAKDKPKKILIWAELKDSPRGVVVSKKSFDQQTGVELVEERPLSYVSKIEWKNEPQLRQARNDLMQGNAAAALATAERFLLFFKDMKAVPGSLWLEAAIIKLDALDREENDTILDTFIREIESAPGTSEVEGLPQRIKLVRLRQMLRKGEYQRVLRDSEDLIKKEDSPPTLAQLTMLKGRAEFNLGKYEEALYTFLRVPVFYGNQTEYVPASKLEVARCLLKLDTPDRKAQKLPELAESYIMEVVNEYPMTPEAKDALALLPKDKQDAIAARDSLEEAQKRAAVAASIASSDSSDDGTASSSDGDGNEIDIDEDDAELEIDDSDAE